MNKKKASYSPTKRKRLAAAARREIESAKQAELAETIQLKKDLRTNREKQHFGKRAGIKQS